MGLWGELPTRGAVGGAAYTWGYLASAMGFVRSQRKAGDLSLLPMGLRGDLLWNDPDTRAA